MHTQSHAIHATITITHIHRHMCTYKHMYTLHTHTYTDAHMHAFMCALNTHNHIHVNNIFIPVQTQCLHTTLLVLPCIWSWADRSIPSSMGSQLLKCCGMHYLVTYSIHYLLLSMIREALKLQKYPPTNTHDHQPYTHARNEDVTPCIDNTLM